MSDVVSPSRRSKRVRSSSVDDMSDASRSPARATRSPDQKRNKNGVHLAPTFETDPKKIQARLKQIGFGKNTVGYDNYVAAIPKNERRGYTEHPRTPDPYEMQSKRSFDGRIKAWRRELHKWDSLLPPPLVDPSVALLGSIGCSATLDQTMARQAQQQYNEGLAAISEQAAATTAARAAAKAADTDARFEEYMTQRDQGGQGESISDEKQKQDYGKVEVEYEDDEDVL